MASNKGKIVLPLQHAKRGRGRPGYKGANIDVVNDDGKVVAHGQTDSKAAKTDAAAADADSGKASKKS